MKEELITQWITAGKPDVLLYVYPKAYYKIKQQWRTKGEKRNINKVFPYSIGRNPELLT